MNTSTDITDPPVTVSILQRVRPGCEQEFEELANGICHAVKQFEGHLGSYMFRPDHSTESEYRIIFKFDHLSNLRRWEESETRRTWIQKRKALTLGKGVQILNGLEIWLSLDNLNAAKSVTIQIFD
jgi:uncharacterized protein